MFSEVTVIQLSSEVGTISHPILEIWRLNYKVSCLFVSFSLCFEILFDALERLPAHLSVFHACAVLVRPEEGSDSLGLE